MWRSEDLSTLLAFLSHPLVLVGVLLLALFGLYDRFIDAGIFPTLPPEDTAPVLLALLTHGFWIGLAVVVLGFGLQLYKLFLGRPLVVPNAERAALLAQHNRQRMVEKVRQMWVEGVLEQSLYQVARIELGLSEKPEAIELPWKLVAQQPERKPYPLPDGTPMFEVFEQFDKTLLVLGAPGSGKTTLLLELTRDLIERAREDATHSIPVMFNLSSWAVKRPPLAEWLVDELNQRYDVPRKVAQAWVESDQVLPLLDGLDEVAREHRDACVEAINAFRSEHGLLPLVVCSRSADYVELSAQLRLSGAVTIQPLLREQVEAYLERAGTALSGVRAAVQGDDTIWELLDTPLMISILALAYQGGTASSVRIARLKGSLEERRSALFDVYIEAMFKRRDSAVPYPPAETCRWLSWLASVMMRHKQTVFYLERVQPDWLEKEYRYVSRADREMVSVRTFAITMALIFALISGLAGDKSGALLQVLFDAFIGGLVAGVFFLMLGSAIFLARRSRSAQSNSWPSSSQEVIQPVDTLRWSWRGARKPFMRVVAWVLGFAMGGWALDIFVPGLFVGLVLGMLFGLIDIFEDALVAQEIGETMRPNEGIRRSVSNALLAGLAAGLTTIIAFVVPLGLLGGEIGMFGTVFGICFSALMSVLVGLEKGGRAGIKHGVLRLRLWRYDYAPLQYVRFLEHAKDLLFLRRVGGGYIFVHRMLMEHFAGMEDAASTKNSR